MCSNMGPFGFILFGTPWASQIWMSVSFLRLENSQLTFFQIKFLSPLSDPYNKSVPLDVVPQVPQAIFTFLNFHFFCYFVWVSSTSLILPSPSSSLLLNPSSVFFSSVIFYSCFLCGASSYFLSFEVLFASIHSFLILLCLSMTITLDTLSDQLLISISLSLFLGFIFFFHLECIPLFSHFV